MKKLLILALLLFIPSIVSAQCYNGSGAAVDITGFSSSDMIIVGNYGNANDSCTGSGTPETCCTGVDAGTCSDIPTGYDLYCRSWQELWDGFGATLLGDVTIHIDPIVFYETVEPAFTLFDTDGFNVHVSPSNMDYSPSTSDITTGPRFECTYGAADDWFVELRPTNPGGEGGSIIIEGITMYSTDVGPYGWFRIDDSAAEYDNPIIIRNCVMRGGSGTVHGISFANTNGHELRATNNYIYNSGIGIFLPSAEAPSGDSFIANNTITKNATGIDSNSQAATFYNNLVVNNSTADFANIGSATGYNNLCSDATCTDANWSTSSGNVPSTAIVFTAENEDEYFLAAADTAAINAGYDIDALPTYSDSLVVHYEFESGALTTDSSGNGYTLTATGPPTLNSDAPVKTGSGAVDFSSGQNYYILNDDADAIPGVDAASDMTVCTWFKPGNAAAGGATAGIWQGGNNKAWYIAVGSDGTITFYVNNNSDQSDWQTSTGTVTDDGTVWYFLGVSWNNTSRATRILVLDSYGDVVFEETDTLSYVMGTSVAAGQDFAINAKSDLSADLANSMDDFRIYDIELTSDEMKQVAIERDGLRQRRIGDYDIGAYEYVAGDRDFYVSDNCGTPGDGTTTDCDGGADDRFDDFSDIDDLGLRPGDTVHLYEGDTWADEFKPARIIGSVNNRITITSYDQTAADPIITGASGTNNMTLINPYMVDIENIDIENNAGDMGIRIEGGDNVTIKDTDVSWGSPDGILLYWLNDFWLDNVTSNNNDSIGLHVRGTTGTNDVRNSSFDNNHQTSDEIYGWGVWISSHLTPYEQSHGAVATSTFDEFEDDVYDEDVDFHNCTASNNGYMGFGLADGDVSYCTADSNGDGWMSMEVWGFSLSSEGSALADGDEVIQIEVTATMDADSSGDTLEDDNGDFVNAGVEVDDWVYNITDQSKSQVASVDLDTIVTDSTLTFSDGDEYMVGEAGTVHHYKSSEHTRAGTTNWLSVHPLTGSSGNWDTAIIYKVTSFDKVDAYSWTPAAAVDCVTDSSDWSGAGFDWRYNEDATFHHCIATNTVSPSYKVQQEGFGFNFDDASKNTIGWSNISAFNDGAGYEFNYAGYGSVDNACKLYNSTSYNNCQDDSSDCGELHIHFNNAYEEDCYIEAKNNIFYGGDSGGVALLANTSTDAQKVEIDYNIYYMDADGDVTIDWEGADYVADHVSTNDFDDFVTANVTYSHETNGQAVLPGLEDPDNSDFTLASDSTIMDDGDDFTVSMGCTDCTDYHGLSRPQDGDNDGTTGFDPGADEYRYGPAINGPWGWTITGGSIQGVPQ